MLFASKNPKWPALILIAGMFASARMVYTQRLSGPPSGPSVTVLTPSPGSQPDFVGSDACRSCHRAEFVQFNKTSHARLKSSASMPVMSCESCHGPGKAHVEGQEAARGDEAKTLAANKLIFAFRANPKQNAERCLSCHTSSRQQDSFIHSGHMAGGISCNSCHSIHLVDEVKDQIKGYRYQRVGSLLLRLKKIS